MSSAGNLGVGKVGAAGQRLSLPLELAVSSLLAAVLAWVLLSLAPVGPDFAAHAYGRMMFLRHGFALWDNFWYAGRYTFVTYSLLYYPLAAALGIRSLAVATAALSVLGFALVVNRQWGPSVRWSSRTFAVMWSGILLSAVFPFALGAAFGLLALAAIQHGYRARFAALAALTVAASPLAFLLLVVILGAAALGSDVSRQRLAGPTLAVGGLLGLEVLLWTLFPAAEHSRSGWATFWER